MENDLCPTCGRKREYCDVDPEITCVLEAGEDAAGTWAVAMAKVAKAHMDNGDKLRQEISNLKSQLRSARDLIDRLDQVIETLRGPR